MENIFVGALCLGAIAQLYAFFQVVPLWITGQLRQDKRQAHRRRALFGYGLFVLTMSVGWMAGRMAALALESGMN